MPGADPSTALSDFAATGVRVATQLAAAPRVAAEPPLACYTTVIGCPGQQLSPSKQHATPKTCLSRRDVRLYLDHFGFRVTKVTVGGKPLKITRRDGRRVVTIQMKRRPAATITVRITGRTSAGKTRRITRRYRICTAGTRHGD